MGDLRNALKKIQTAARVIKLNPTLDIKEISEGSVKEYLRVYHYLLLDYNAQVAADILNKHNVELSYANDKAFVDGLYRLCRDMLAYAPRLTKDQFFHAGYAQAKAEMAADIVERVRALTPHSSSTAPASAAATGTVTVINSSSAIGSNSSTTSPLACGGGAATNSRPVTVNISRQPSTKAASLSTYQNGSQRPQVTRSTTITSTTHRSTAMASRETRPASPHNGSTSSVEETNINKATSTTTAESLVGLVEKINDMHAKMNQLSEMVQRVDQIDKRLANVEKLVTESQSAASNHSSNGVELAKLTKAYEGITNKMTVLETDLLVIKQSLTQQQQQQQQQQSSQQPLRIDRLSKEGRLSYDPNDSTTYETPHQSFMVSPKVIRHANNDSTSHDETLNGVDLTPTLGDTTTTPANVMSRNGTMQKTPERNELEAKMLMARELLQKAALIK